jgi:hypothetical protein
MMNQSPSPLNRKAIRMLIAFGTFQILFFLVFLNRSYFLQYLPQPFGLWALCTVATGLVFLCLLASLGIGAALRQRPNQTPPPDNLSADNQLTIHPPIAPSYFY